MFKKIAALVLLCLCLALPASAQISLTTEWEHVSRVPDFLDLYLVCCDGLWGLSKRNGELLFEPQFRYEPEFQSSYAVVARLDPLTRGGFSDAEEYGSLYGVISAEGKIVIPLEYEEMSLCDKGIALIHRGLNHFGRNYCYLKPDGTRLTAENYSDARAFEGGYAAVARESTLFADDEDGDAALLWGLIDESGNEVLPLEYDAVGFYPDGTVAASIDGVRLHYEIKNGEAIEISAVQSPKASL